MVGTLQSLPLDDWLAPRGIDMRELSSGYSTSLYRGYIGFWEVFDDTLYLIGLFDFQNQPFDPGVVFGDLCFPLEADWFSGRLDIDCGDRLAYVHFGWGSLSAQRLRLYIEHGQVMRRRCYDQTKLLRRRFAETYANYEDFRQQLIADASSPLGPLGGFTEAGLRVLGLPPFEGEPAWPASLSDDEMSEWIQPLLAQCIRPGAGAPTGSR